MFGIWVFHTVSLVTCISLLTKANYHRNVFDQIDIGKYRLPAIYQLEFP